MNTLHIFAQTNWFALISFLLLSCAEVKEQETSTAPRLSINALQDGKSYPTSTELSLAKKPFDLVFSFPEIPAEADTTILVLYWATTNPEFEEKFKNASHIDSVSMNSEGINISSDNKDEYIVTNMQGGHKGIMIEKKGSSKDITHSFANIQRVGNRLDAYYKVSNIYDVLQHKSIPIESITDQNLYIYFAVFHPKTFKQLEGHYVHLKLK